MGTLQQDIHDLNSALDFFAGYAPQEGVVPVDYEVMLLHSKDQKLSVALNFARQKITGHLTVSEIATIPGKHRAAAVLWFVATLAQRKGEELGRIYQSLLTYPPEILAKKFGTPGHITEWVQMGAAPCPPPEPKVVKAPTDDEVQIEITANRLAVVLDEGIVTIKRFGARLTPDEALALSRELKEAVMNLDASLKLLYDARAEKSAKLKKAAESAETG